MPIKKSMDERERILNLVHEEEKENTDIPFMSAPKKRSNKFLKVLLSVAVVILVIFLILFGISKYTQKSIFSFSGKTGEIWQAVFLSNGQVYFGHVVKENNKEVILKDIYYLQVNKQIQPTEQETAQLQPELSLVKLGSELHGPTDEMRVNRFHVLFIEDLKPDSRVSIAIKEYAAKK